MAHATGWVKRLNKRTPRRHATVMASYTLNGELELLMVDEDGRLMSCLPDHHELITLYQSLYKHLHRGESPTKAEE